MNKKLLVPLFLLVGAGSALLAFRSRTDGSIAICRPAAVAAAALAPARVVAEGRVAARAGAEVVVGTDTGGTLVKLLVSEKDRVEKGQLIARIDSSVDERALEQARARVTEAEADLRLAEADRERAAQLLATKVGSRQSLDKGERDRDAAAARQATAVADVRRLEAVIRKASITAPISGVVTLRHVEQGETVDRGARLVTIADLDRIRVEAEVDEADTGRVRPGARVTVRAEGEGGAWEGRVEEIPDQVTPRKLKPQDPARPSDTRVLLVKVAVNDPKGLKLGRRVDVEIAGAGTEGGR
jgi:RND family efflux transporter MFP subunit